MTIPGDIVLKPNPTPDRINDPFGKLMDADEVDRSAGVQQSAFVASQRKDPQRWAKVLETAKRMKVNPSFVDQNWDAISQQDAHAKLVRDTNASPGLATWLQDPDNATIAKDELPALARIDRGVRLIVPPQPVSPDAAVIGSIPRAPVEPTAYDTGFQRSVQADSHPRDWKMDAPHAALTGYNDMRAAAGQLAVAYGLATPEQAAHFVSESNKRSADLRAQEPAYAKEYSQAMAEHRTTIDEIVAGAPTFGRGKILNALKGYAIGNVQTLGELLGMIGSAVTNPVGFGYSTVETLPGMLPALAFGAGGAAVGSVPGLIGGTLIGMAPLNVGSEINAEMAKRGYDITNPDDLRRAYADPALMAEIRGKASRAGVTSAGVSALTAAFAGALSAKAVGAGPVTRAAATAGDVAVQAGGQGVAQLAGQVAGEKGDLSKVSLGAAAETAVSMLGYGIGETAIGASRRGLFHSDPVIAAHQATEGAAQAMKAQHDAQALAEIGTAIKEAPVTSTVPDRVKTLIETATGGAEPAHAVFFHEAEWDAYWQSKGESPAKIAADVMGDGGRGYDEAKSTGAPIAIPLSDYISKVATTEHFDGLLNVARTEPDGMSLGEAHEYLQSLPATLGELAKEAESAPEIPRATTIRESIAQQLTEAGRTPAEAKAMGTVYESAFTTLGQRAGIHPQLLFDRYRLGVRGPEQIARAEAAAQEAKRASAGVPETSDEFEAQLAQQTLGDPEAGKLARPRTQTGRLKNLSKATPEELANEYRILIDANASENVAPSTIDDNAGRLWQGIKPAAMKAMGRVAARAKSIAKIEAELAKRNIQPSDAYMQATSLARNIEPTAFSFEQSKLTPHTERRALTDANIAARAAFDAVANEIRAFPEERRQMLITALKAHPEMLELKQSAYHGSPHVFDEFSLHKIGTGEGAQAYGWGLYFAGKKEVAEYYRNALSDWNAPKPRGRLYKVEIPEDNTMLDWDKPLGQQSEFVKKALEEAGWGISKLGTKAHRGKDSYDQIAFAAARADQDRINAGETVTPRNWNRVASEKLAEVGITGIKYLDNPSRDAGEGTHNYVIFDDKLVKILEYEQAQAGSEDPRGRIRINPETRQAMIDLFKPADRSTFLHESGHLYLEVLGDLATADKAAPEISKDYSTILNWLGVENRSQLETAHHEQFARGFEAYLMEGKAPSAALREAFFRFKNWLTRIYKEVAGLNVSLSPEIRNVFDRILASDAEIKQAEIEQQTQPLFDDPKAVGLTDEEAQKYSAVVNEANQAATEELTTRLMREIRREESKDWKILKEGIRSAVEQEAEKNPILRALSLLTRGKTPLGNELPSGQEPFKLSRQAIVDDFGKQRLESLPRPYVYAREGGVHPDVAAEMLGFRSGDELLTALSNAQKPSDWINAETSKRMQAEHGERMSDLQVRQAAWTAVRNDKRAQVLRKELEILASDHMATLKGLVRKITSAIPPTEEVRAQADKIIGEKAVKDIRPILYERAATRNAVEAREALLRGDIPAAFEAKRKELLATQVLRSAENAKAQVQEGLIDFKKLFRKDATLAKTRDMDLVNAARSVLSAFEIGSAKGNPDSYLSQIKQYDPEMATVVEGIVNDLTGNAVNYKDMPYQDFQALRESVKGLWNMSRRVTQIEIDGVKVDRAQVQDELSVRIAELAKPGEQPGYSKAVTNWEKTERNLMTSRSWLRRVEHWVDAMDGGNPEGPFRKYFWNPVSEGISTYRIAKRASLEKYLEIVRPVEKTMKGGKIQAPELGYTFEGKAELLGALLHRGNESNLSKLLRGRKWGNLLEDGTLDSSRWDAMEKRLQTEGVLTKADYDYAQGVWDLFDEQKPGAQKAHKEMFGYYFNEVTAKSFDTPFGTYKGGYVPAKADPFLVPDVQVKREAESLTSGADNSFMFPTTGRGFTKTRIEAYAKPLIMNVAYVPSQLDAVLRFTHIEPRVKDVGRMVVSPSFRPTLDGFDPTVGGTMLVPWLQRAAQQRVDLPGKFPAIDRFFRELRTRTGLQIMTANVLNAAQQLTGLSISALKVEPTRLKSALWQYVRDPKGTSASIAEKSPFMRTRMTATVMEVQKAIDHIMLDPSTYDKARSFATEHGYFLASGTQSVVDHITWMGKYDQALGEGSSEKDAVRQADSAVRETQGSFAPEDISRVEAQTPFVRAFLQFYSYFNMQANVLGTEFLNTSRNLGLKKGAGRLLFAYVAGFAIPAILSQGLMTATSGRPFDEDDDGPADDVLRLFFGSQYQTATRFVPIVGQLSDAIIGQFTAAKYDDSIRLSPAVTTLERTLAVPVDVYKAIQDREITNKGILDVLTAIGLLSGFPIAPLAKPITYLRKIQSGDAEPKNAYEYGRGLVTGH